MFLNESFGISENGHLTFGGCDCVSLAEKYNTPLYVMDETAIRRNCRAYKNALDKFYDGNALVIYASKAFSSRCMYKIVQEEGLGVDVVSGGEIYTALSAGFPADKIYFHGSNKSEDELKYAVENHIGRIMVDNYCELNMLDEIAGDKGLRQKVILRVTPGVDAHTHSFIRTGQIDSKFGVAIDTGEAFYFVKEALSLENIEVTGLHCHIGSQIFDYEPFACAAEKMMAFIAELKEKIGFETKELDLGGGFGIKYTHRDDPIPYEQFMEKISLVIKNLAAEKGVALPFIIMEPGRSIVGEAGITLYTVGCVKQIPGYRKYVSVDGGMGDNPRYALYEAEYEAVSANNPESPFDDVATIAGKCCESGDIIIKDGKLQEMHKGDIAAVLSTGAYNYSMASNYNRIPKPAVVMVKDGESRIAVKRETYEDLIRNDVL